MIPRHAEQLLERAAQTVIDRVCKTQIGAMKSAPTIEVNFIASLIVNGVSELQSAWQSVLPSLNVHIGGIFCHGAPKVSIRGTCPRPLKTKTQSCELADLLVLHTHQVKRRTYRRGVLIQTKLDNKPRFTPDEPQFWLYDAWPQFSIRSPGFDPRDRDFADDRRSGRYGLVSPQGWLISEPTSPMVRMAANVQPFSQFLGRMLYDSDPAQDQRNSVHGRQVYKRSKADWSKTVWDLINITANKPLMHRQLFPSAISSRQGGTLAFQSLGLNLPPDGTVVDPTGEEESDGVSIFHMYTGSK